MLACEGLTVRLKGVDAPILNNAAATFPQGGLHAVVGPSGCGKTTLVKAMLGLLPAEGDRYFCGAVMERDVTLAGKVGYAPQFSIAHPALTVRENLQDALDLCCSDEMLIVQRLGFVLNLTGLADHKDKRAGSLSGGQLRRLGLAMELVGDPPCLVCDEVTSGLDPNSEQIILALLRALVEDHGKTILCIIHNLGTLDRFDSITVLQKGQVAFQGSPDALKSYFGIDDFLHLYAEMEAGEVDWARRWEESHCDPEEPGMVGGNEELRDMLPTSLAQTRTLLRRRFRLLFRDHGYLGLLLAITFGFPLLVVIFAWNGLPEIEGLALERSITSLESIQEDIRFRIDAAETAGLVTGLVMFQVILLALAAANNGAREIASERKLFEKECFNGLRPGSYLASKLIFTATLSLFQGAWMAFFVKAICQFPGSWFIQMMILGVGCMAMAWVCLGFSALLSNPEKANMLSIYLVGFQLPLSGVVLALPEALVWLCRPFINAYWGWAGYLSSMRDSRLFDAFRMTDSSYLPSIGMALAVLILQAACGLTMAYVGCRRRHGF
jgi:ABC-type multidrug transport system ATPase subunit